MAVKAALWPVMRSWFARNFSRPEAVGLFLTLIVGFVLFEFFRAFSMPVLVAVVLAYLLNSVVRWLKCLKVPHLMAVTVVFLLFVGAVLLLLFGLLPFMVKQLTNLARELPAMLGKSQLWVNDFVQHHPTFFAEDPLAQAANFLRTQSSRIGQWLLSFSLTTIPSVIELILYFILVPLLVFFFLKDGATLTQWFSRYLPAHRGALDAVWVEVHQKIGAYVRGRVVEMLLVAVVSVIAFRALGLPYGILLGVFVGVSVMVPYIGAVVVTIPVAILGLISWGFSAHFGYLLAVYAAIIALDANVLFPLLFSETMDLHPVVIILAVLLFGGIWGFWGVFFAIPLASFVKAILYAWPQARVPVRDERQHQR